MDETGKVGAFWIIPGPRVIGEACDLALALETDGVLNGPLGHGTLWERLERPAAFIGRAYTTVPRGRVLFMSSPKRFVVYAAVEVLKNPEAREAVETFYGIGSSAWPVLWRRDSHYVTQPELFDEDFQP